MKQKLNDALRGVSRVYFDSAPLIYYVERHPSYIDVMRTTVKMVQAGIITAVAGPVTLAECLIVPLRNRDHGLVITFFNTITRSHNLEYWPRSMNAPRAAKIRAVHNLRLPDAFQVATALDANCDAILTNDSDFKRLTQIPVLVLSELEL